MFSVYGLNIYQPWPAYIIKMVLINIHYISANRAPKSQSPISRKYFLFLQIYSSTNVLLFKIIYSYIFQCVFINKHQELDEYRYSVSKLFAKQSRENYSQPRSPFTTWKSTEENILRELVRQFQSVRSTLNGLNTNSLYFYSLTLHKHTPDLY